MVQPIPDNYPRVTSYLCVDGAEEAIDFYTKVLGFTERMRIGGGGKIGHAELELGDSLIMLSDVFEDMGALDPKHYKGSPVSLMIYVEDCDAVHAAAIEAGATETRPVEDQFYGDRSGGFTDPWGHSWGVSTHVEDIDPEELARRSAENMPG